MYIRILIAALAATSVMTGAAIAAGSGKATHVVIDRDSQSMKVYNGTQVIASSRVSTGKQGYSTPTGIFSILQKRRRHFSNLYNNAPMPNMQRLTWTGIALHGSGSVPRYPASHGCIRLPRGFDSKLFKLTRNGAHVVVARGNVVPQITVHETLFQPTRPIVPGLVEINTGTISDATRPSAVAARISVLKGQGGLKSDGRSKSPLRIFITRGGAGVSDTLLVQKMLNELGWNAGAEDGLFGRQTQAAIRNFQSLVGAPVTGSFNKALILQLRSLTGREKEPTGHIYVRQDFKPVFDAPITINNPHLALGAHLISAVNMNTETGTTDWISMTLKDRLSPAQRKRYGVSEDNGGQKQDIKETLARFDIPQDVRDKIETLLTPGSSITISDKGFSNLTSRKGGTDFIVRTSG